MTNPTESASGLAQRAALHVDLGLQARDVAVDRRHRERPPLALVAKQAVPALDVAVNRNAIPLLGVADVVDRHVVMLTPEERHRVELLALAHHVERRGLALALRHDPVLDADVLPGMRIGPTRDVASSIDARDAR